MEKRTQCALPGCGGLVSDWHQFCRPCYSKLLPPARKALKYANRAKKEDTEFSADQRMEEAVQKAVMELQRPPAWF